MGRRLIPWRRLSRRGRLSPQPLSESWSHAVLAFLSEGYPPPGGRLPTCYSPVRRFTGVAPFSLDLHVLSAPLTFVLSQDQTLQLNPVCSGPAKEPAALTSQAGSPKRAARESVTCEMRRDLPKQTGALNRAHVTFVTYAYNPVFKDRAES